jgi:dTMP kinase
MKILKNFVVFEGGDGSGTTTQMNLLRLRFQGLKQEARWPLPQVYYTFEPSEGPVGKLIRGSLRGDYPLSPRTAALLFAADRQEHLFGPEGVLDRCNRGELVICDRYVLSSLVYQGISCGEAYPEELNRDFPLPELLFYFDVPVETAQKRMEKRQVREIYESLDFQKKVEERYRSLLPRFGGGGVRIVRIDASRPPQEVGEDLWKELQKLPILKGGGFPERLPQEPVGLW